MSDNAKIPESHESYGVIQISRVSCSPHTNLFGSSVRHGNFVSLKICEGRKTRDFQADRYHDGERLVEVSMSATQFANAITSLNMGCGTPVTIDYVKGDEFNEQTRKYRERCPEVNARQIATTELKIQMSELGNKVDALAKDSVEILGRKGTIKSGDKKKLLSELSNLVTEIRSNIPFTHECFNRSVDNTVTEAKGEIDATLQVMREKLGDQVLAGAIEIPMLEEGKEID